jgi:hypothetical protein
MPALLKAGGGTREGALWPEQPLTQPPGRRIEQRLRPLIRRPRPRIHPCPQLRLGELPVLQNPPQLPHLLQPPEASAAVAKTCHVPLCRTIDGP